MIAIDNKYRLEKQISHDEKYDIWEAFDLQLERKIIVEIFHDPKLETKVKEYVQLYAQIKHPNLMSVYTAGMFQSQPYIVFEYVEGKPINTYTQHTINDWKILALFFKQIVDGLHTLHEKKMGHYHLTVNHILICPNNEAMLLMDFPKWILEEQHLFVFDDIIALGEVLQTFFTDNRVPAKLLEIVQKTKQCRLVEYTTNHILHDLEEFLSIDNPRFVSTSPNVFCSKTWVILGILFVIFSCVIIKYAYDKGAFKGRNITPIIRELDESERLERVKDSFGVYQKRQNKVKKFQKIQELEDIEENFQTRQKQENNIRNFQTQQESKTEIENESKPEINEKILKIQKQYDDLMQIIKEKKNKLRKYSQNCDELENQQATLTRDIEKSQSTLERLLKQKDSVQTQYQALEAQINLKKNAYQKSATLWKKYQSNYTRAERESEELHDKIEHAHNEKKELESKLYKIQSDRTRLENRMKIDKKRIPSGKNSGSNFYRDKKEISALKSEYNKKERELKQLDNQIQHFKLEIERTTKRIKTLEKNMAERQNECEKLERIRNEMQSHEQKQERLESIKQEIENLSTQYNQEREKERSLNEELNDIQTDLLIRKEYYNSLQNEIKDDESKAQLLRQQL